LIEEKLFLSWDGKWYFKTEAPAKVTKAELERIQNWISLQLIVEEDPRKAS
jgi:hypothetical protein